MLDAHRKGLGGMVNSKAGLSNLGLDGFVKRTLLQYVSLFRLMSVPVFAKH